MATGVGKGGVGTAGHIFARHYREKYDVDSAVQGIPLGSNKEYDRACYLRYFAMASVGGGWMSDYDLIPINLKPKAIPNCEVYRTMKSAVPRLRVWFQQEWERMAYVLTETGRNMMGKTDLFSDMMALQALPLDYLTTAINVLGYNEKKGSIRSRNVFGYVLPQLDEMARCTHIARSHVKV